MTFSPPSHRSTVTDAPQRPWGVTLLAVIHALAVLLVIPIGIAMFQHPPSFMWDISTWIIALLMVSVLGGSVLLCSGIAYGLWMLQRRTYYLTLLIHAIASIGNTLDIVQHHKPVATSLLVSGCIVIYLLLPRTKAAFQPEVTH